MKTNTVTQFVGNNYMLTSDCIAVAFFRPSTDTNDVRVNGIPIEAGQTLSITQNTGDFDVTQYEIVFTDLGAPNTNELYILRTLIVK